MSHCSGDTEFEGKWWQYPPLRNPLIAGLLALSGFILAWNGVISVYTETVIYWIAIPVGAWVWTLEGLEALWKEHEIGISFLMIAATAGSGILGLWEEAVSLVVLYGAAEGIEEYTFSRTRKAIRALLDLAPKEIRVIRNNQETMIPAEDIMVGELFSVRPGESLSTDGIIVEGMSSLDEAAVTGESVPVDKEPGDKVFAASINGHGSLKIRVSKTFKDNSLSRIIHLVEEAQDQKGKAQSWMERFGRRYSPLVLLTAILFVVVPYFLGMDISPWAEKAVILLVAAAPCALVISLPITMTAGIAGAGRRGILIKGGAHLEHLGVIKTIAFDKTGTLTHGKPEVTDVMPLDNDRSGLLTIAASLEQNSEHPLAHAIRQYADNNHIKTTDIKHFSIIAGSGAQADINGETWYIGKPDFFTGLGLDITPLSEKVSGLQDEGKTVVLVGTDKMLSGMIAMQDTLRENVTDVIHSIKRMGIRTVMLTGDNKRTALRVASRLGIDDVRADLHPEDKVNAIRELAAHGEVLMVGDGINDAPALAAATCGVAMGAAGTDAALEAADIALMADDLGKLEEAMFLGRKARKVSLQNIIFAITVLVILIPAGVSGFISIATAVLVHEASELLAVANGLRAKNPN